MASDMRLMSTVSPTAKALYIYICMNKASKHAFKPLALAQANVAHLEKAQAIDPVLSGLPVNACDENQKKKTFVT